MTLSSTVPVQIVKCTSHAKDNTSSCTRALNFSDHPSEIKIPRSCASSMSSLTASPSVNVRNIKKLILEETEHSQAQETDELNLLRQLQLVEEMREKVYGLVNKNKRLRTMLTSKNIILDDYISEVHACSTSSNNSDANVLSRREAASRGSKDSNLSIIEGKRKHKKSTAACIIDT